MARCRHEWGPWEMADWLLDEGIYTGYGRKCILCNLATPACQASQEAGEEGMKDREPSAWAMERDPRCGAIRAGATNMRGVRMTRKDDYNMRSGRIWLVYTVLTAIEDILVYGLCGTKGEARALAKKERSKNADIRIRIDAIWSFQIEGLKITREVRG